MLRCLGLQCNQNLNWNLLLLKSRVCFKLYDSTSKNFYTTDAHNLKYKSTFFIKKQNFHSTVATNAKSIIEQNSGQYESNSLPKHAKTVICGGGVMGAAVAYHLAAKGFGSEVVLLEQDR